MPVAALTSPSERPDIASVAALIADRSRAAVLLALHDGRALPASQLALEAGVTASTISGHLARLARGGLVRVQASGRHRYYRLAGADVADVVELLALLGPDPTPPRSMRSAGRMRRLRRARSCYDHCAGRLGTAVLGHLVITEALVRTDGYDGVVRNPGEPLAAQLADAPYALGPAAIDVFAGWGVDVDDVRSAKRPALRVCVDWTEQAHHLAGGLGAAVLGAFLDQGWVRRTERPRELEVTDDGARALADLGVPAA